YVNGTQPPMEKVLLTPVMGMAYIGSCTLLNIAAGVMRFTDGLVNVPVGLAMLGSDKEPDTALYEPIHGENTAVVDYGGIYFGASYCEGFSQKSTDAAPPALLSDRLLVEARDQTRPGTRTTVAAARASRSPTGARRPMVMAAATPVIPRRSMTPMAC